MRIQLSTRGMAVVGGLVALLLWPALALADNVGVKKVTQYAGTAVITTDAPNTVVKVTYPEDESTLRVWKGTTDSEGRIAIVTGNVIDPDKLKVYTVPDPPDRGDKESGGGGGGQH